ncbi:MULTISPECIES: hypothetical protein [unclassified Rhizobium]|uniref:hypothetical protein n=1 Tax=unclassified Rhizobium TaxID=2613769 RepID=UPI00117BB0D3|nr:MULTISPECIES: hypothetical protein [unclassified Rhizobium]
MSAKTFIGGETTDVAVKIVAPFSAFKRCLLGPTHQLEKFFEGDLETKNIENQIEAVGSPEGGRKPGTQVSAAFLPSRF